MISISANLYDLAARDLRKGVDPTETLEGLSKATYLDPAIQRAAQTVLDDMRGAYSSPISNMALSPGVLENAIYPRAKGDAAPQHRRAPAGLLESEASLRRH